MPIYEFKCRKCFHRFEELLPYEKDAEQCPRCEARDVVKLMSVPTFALKGGGWFKDGYSKDNPTSATQKSGG
jgi:putative FmdB family regulatory protein